VPTREEIQTELNEKLAEAREGLEKLKAKLTEAGDETTEEMSEAIDKAEQALARGRAKLAELTGAPDETFDKVWAESKETWSELSQEMEGHWDEFAARVKHFFS
jgi:uncharacterized coiled-coil protein SlyX